MKKILLLLTLIFVGKLQSQDSHSNHSLSIEIIPTAILMANANGANVIYNYQHNRFIHSLTAGFIFSNFSPGNELGSITINGEPLVKWSSEIDIETPRPYPLGGVVNQIDFENLDSWGFKHYKPKMSFRLNRYFIYEILYKLLDKKFNIFTGIGTTIGITNREDTWVGFTGKIMNNVSGLSEEMWININIRAKYLYLGWTGKLIVDYPITERLTLGLSGGFHYIFNKEWRADETLYYVGVLSKIRI